MFDNLIACDLQNMKRSKAQIVVLVRQSVFASFSVWMKMRKLIAIYGGGDRFMNVYTTDLWCFE